MHVTVVDTNQTYLRRFHISLPFEGFNVHFDYSYARDTNVLTYERSRYMHLPTTQRNRFLNGDDNRPWAHLLARSFLEGLGATVVSNLTEPAVEAPEPAPAPAQQQPVAPPPPVVPPPAAQPPPAAAQPPPAAAQPPPAPAQPPPAPAQPPLNPNAAPYVPLALR